VAHLQVHRPAENAMPDTHISVQSGVGVAQYITCSLSSFQCVPSSVRSAINSSAMTYSDASYAFLRVSTRSRAQNRQSGPATTHLSWRLHPVRLWHQQATARGWRRPGSCSKDASGSGHNYAIPVESTPPDGAGSPAPEENTRRGRPESRSRRTSSATTASARSVSC